MIYPFSARTCVAAWLQATSFLLTTKDRRANNVILDIEEPTLLDPGDRLVVEALDKLLAKHGQDPVITVAGTIFPASHYTSGGANAVFHDFPEKVYPKIKKNWGTYAGRILRRQGRDGSFLNPLEILVNKLKAQTNGKGHLRAAYEIGLIDPLLEIPIYEPASDAKLTLNQPCLAHLSFKVVGADTVMLTALYRSHYYVQRALGNLIGLAHLLAFVAAESGLKPGGLVCHSTAARIDTVGGWGIREVTDFIHECNTQRKEDRTWALTRW